MGLEEPSVGRAVRPSLLKVVDEATAGVHGREHLAGAALVIVRPGVPPLGDGLFREGGDHPAQTSVRGNQSRDGTPGQPLHRRGEHNRTAECFPAAVGVGVRRRCAAVEHEPGREARQVDGHLDGLQSPERHSDHRRSVPDSKEVTAVAHGRDKLAGVQPTHSCPAVAGSRERQESVPRIPVEAPTAVADRGAVSSWEEQDRGLVARQVHNLDRPESSRQNLGHHHATTIETPHLGCYLGP